MHSLQMIEKAIDIARRSEGTSSWEGHLLYSASTSIAQRPVPKSLGPWQTSGGLDASKVVTHLGRMSSHPVHRCLLTGRHFSQRPGFLPCAHWSGRQDQVSGQVRHPQIAAHTSGVRVSASIMTGSVS